MNKEEKIIIEEDFKPRTWLLIVLIIIGLGITVVLVDKVIEDKKKKDAEEKEKIDNFSSNFFDNFKEQYDNAKKEYDENVNKVSTSSFNGEFELLSGTKSGFFVTTLLDKVITSNKKQSEHIINVTYDGNSTTDEEEIRNIKKNLDSSKEYEVILDYDEEGYVNSITIEE